MKITVLYGGHSAEREISLRSGKGVARALESRGHEVKLLDPADPRGRVAAAPSAATAATSPALPPPDPAADAQALQSFEPGGIVAAPAIKDTEVVFIALHGGEGENGTLQALFDLAGVPYTGSGMLSSAMCMDKRVSKQMFEAHGIPTPPWV